MVASSKLYPLLLVIVLTQLSIIFLVLFVEDETIHSKSTPKYASPTAESATIETLRSAQIREISKVRNKGAMSRKGLIGFYKSDKLGLMKLVEPPHGWDTLVI